ncbi:hypothetical protein [Hymenobacter rubidus]|uniref:hypothetical protein n=1 Tax=Hymenobacter rubidus TaxID=1441626 RepID=UPI00191CF0EB|nr:hypothetical protein [Hymenobacter rubidus]
MKAFHVAAIVLGCSLALTRPAFSQVAGADVDLSASVAAAQQPYARAFASHPQLLNGPEYLDYAKRYHARTGHQFFGVPEMQAGSVDYNDHRFANVPLAYDLVLDQVVLSPPNSPLTLRLINEKVQAFSIGSHRFVRLVADSSSGKVIRTGYYEVLVDKPVQVLAKRTKRMQEHLNQRAIDVEFSSADRLFLCKAGQYYPVSSKSSIVRLFADHSKEVASYLQEHRLRFSRAQREASAVALATYYNTLTVR